VILLGKNLLFSRSKALSNRRVNAALLRFSLLLVRIYCLSDYQMINAVDFAVHEMYMAYIYSILDFKETGENKLFYCF